MSIPWQEHKQLRRKFLVAEQTYCIVGAMWHWPSPCRLVLHVAGSVVMASDSSKVSCPYWQAVLLHILVLLTSIALWLTCSVTRMPISDCYEHKRQWSCTSFLSEAAVAAAANKEVRWLAGISWSSSGCSCWADWLLSLHQKFHTMTSYKPYTLLWRWPFVLDRTVSWL